MNSNQRCGEYSNKSRKLLVIFLTVTLASLLIAPALARGAKKKQAVIWLGNILRPSVRWEVKAIPGTREPHTIKLAVTLADGKVDQWQMYGEGNNWRLKMSDQNGVSYGIVERGAYLPGSANAGVKTSPYTFKYKIFVDDEPIAHGTYEWQYNYSYSKKQPEVHKFVLPPVQVDRKDAAGCRWVVSGPRIVFDNLSCANKGPVVPDFVAVFEFLSPDGKVYKCTRKSEKGSCENFAFPDDFAPLFAGYKSGRYFYKTIVSGKLLDNQHFDCSDRSNANKKTQAVTISMPGW